MKKLWDNHIFFITVSFILWRVTLGMIQIFSRVLPLRESFAGANPWGNFDGVHYLLIAKSGYEALQHAFFPLYPLIIGFVSRQLYLDPLFIGLFVSHVCFYLSLIFIYLIAKNEYSKKVARWTIVLLLCYPMSFYFASVYTESMYVLFSAAAFYFFSKSASWRSSVFGLLASATRLFGILIPVSLFLTEFIAKKLSIKILVVLFCMSLGLLGYMYFLSSDTGDMLAFFHEQPVFGAGRSGSAIILLPQVLYRYARIFLSASPFVLQYWISVVELVSFLFASCILVAGYMKRIPHKYLFYSLGVIILPTLSGTLSSMPRYVLSAFPLFIVLSFLLVHKPFVRNIILLSFLVLLVLSASLFLRGWFIS